VCFAAAIVFAVVLAGYGLRALFDDLKSGKSRTKWFGYIFIFSLVMLWWVRETYNGYALFSVPPIANIVSNAGALNRA
jgi:hypothetical protein